MDLLFPWRHRPRPPLPQPNRPPPPHDQQQQQDLLRHRLHRNPNPPPPPPLQQRPRPKSSRSLQPQSSHPTQQTRRPTFPQPAEKKVGFYPTATPWGGVPPPVGAVPPVKGGAGGDFGPTAPHPMTKRFGGMGGVMGEGGFLGGLGGGGSAELEDVVSPLRHMLDALNMAILPHSTRLTAILHAHSLLNHHDRSLHDYELSQSAARILYQKLAMVLTLRDDAPYHNTVADPVHSGGAGDIGGGVVGMGVGSGGGGGWRDIDFEGGGAGGGGRSGGCSDADWELFLLCSCLEMVHRASKEGVERCWEDLGGECLPILVKVMERPFRKIEGAVERAGRGGWGAAHTEKAITAAANRERKMAVQKVTKIIAVYSLVPEAKVAIASCPGLLPILVKITDTRNMNRMKHRVRPVSLRMRGAGGRSHKSEKRNKMKAEETKSVVSEERGQDDEAVSATQRSTEPRSAVVEAVPPETSAATTTLDEFMESSSYQNARTDQRNFNSSILSANVLRAATNLHSLNYSIAGTSIAGTSIAGTSTAGTSTNSSPPSPSPPTKTSPPTTIPESPPSSIIQNPPPPPLSHPPSLPLPSGPGLYMTESSRFNAIATLTNLAAHESNRMAMLAEPGLLDNVSRVVHNERSDVARQCSALAIMNLSNGDREHVPEIAGNDLLLRTLVVLMGEGEDVEVRANGAVALFNVACADRNTVRLVRYRDGEILDVILRIITRDPPPPPAPSHSSSASTTPSLLSENDPTVVTANTKSLSRLSPPTTPPHLPTDQQHDSGVRLNAAEALFNISCSSIPETTDRVASHPDLLHGLARILRSRNPRTGERVRVYCAATLRRMAERVHVPSRGHGALLGALAYAGGAGGEGGGMSAVEAAYEGRGGWCRTPCIAEAFVIQATHAKNRPGMIREEGVLDALACLSGVNPRRAGFEGRRVRDGALRAIELLTLEEDEGLLGRMAQHEGIMNCLTRASYGRESYGRGGRRGGLGFGSGGSVGVEEGKDGEDGGSLQSGQCRRIQDTLKKLVAVM